MNFEKLQAQREELLISIMANAAELRMVASVGDIEQIRTFGMKLFAEIEQLSNVETILCNIQ